VQPVGGERTTVRRDDLHRPEKAALDRVSLPGGTRDIDPFVHSGSGRRTGGQPASVPASATGSVRALPDG